MRDGWRAWWRGEAGAAARRTLLDAGDAPSVVRLVRALDAGDGADGLAERLARLLGRLPPDEPLMRRLSVLHQAHAREGGAVDFCASLVYMVATEVVLRGGGGRRRARAPGRRPASAPPRLARAHGASQ